MLPAELCDILAGLASNPVAALAAPDLQDFAGRCLPGMRPAVAAQLQAATAVERHRDELLAAVRQLGSAASPALAAACCREVQQLLPALKLLAAQEREQAICAMLEAACKHASVPPAGDLVAALLQHHEPGVRQAALAGLAAGQVHGLAVLFGHPAVAGSVVAALTDEGQSSQQLAAGLLQAAAAAASSAAARCGLAVLPWEPWLLCCAGSPVAGPAVASILQLAASQRRSVWQHLTPLALELFHSSPAVAAEAAAQLHTHLVQQRPAAAGAMLFNPLPFDGLLMPAGSGSGSSEVEPGNGASRASATSAAKLFTAGDVQSLLAVASNPALPPELTAAALGQLAQVAGDERFGPMLCSETGGVLADVCMHVGSHAQPTLLLIGSCLRPPTPPPAPAVLASLLGLALDASPVHQVRQHGLDCLVALLEQHPAVADWLAAEADSRILPLLPLVFHPGGRQRQAVARVLHHLLFAAAAQQLHSLAVAPGTPKRLPGSQRLGYACVPEPFCAAHRFPYPTGVLPVGPALYPQPACSVFGSEGVERVWRARQLCEAAAGGCSSGGGLVELLACPSAAALPRWEADLERASLATLRSLQPEGLAEGLQQLAASQDHAQCHAALRHLKLLVAALPQVRLPCQQLSNNHAAVHCWVIQQCHFCWNSCGHRALQMRPKACAWLQGLMALSGSAWGDSLSFLLAAAPLSQEDCCLWLEMLPLLHLLLPSEAESSQPGQLLALVEQFAAGSAYAWVQQQGSQPQVQVQVQAALLPVVLHTVRLVAERCLLRGGSQRQQLLEAFRCQDWLALLCQQVQQGGYAARVAALQLAAVLVSGGLEAKAAGACFTVVARHVLMPRHLWSTEHRHGKAAVAAALVLLRCITKAAPAAAWAATWADQLGSAYWLSRAAGDSSPSVREVAFQLLAAAVAAPATNRLVRQAWPECAVVSARAVLSETEPTGVRAAACAVVAAALSDGLAEQPGTVLPPQQSEEAAEEAAEEAPDAAEGGPGPAAKMQLALVPQPPPSLAAETLLGRAELWEGVRHILEVRLADGTGRGEGRRRLALKGGQSVARALLSTLHGLAHASGGASISAAVPCTCLCLQESNEPALLSTAAHAVLQRMLLDAEGACQLVDTAVLLRLLGCLPATAAALSGLTAGDSSLGTDLLTSVSSKAAEQLAHAARAAHAAAGLVAAGAQLAPDSSCAEQFTDPGLLPAAAAAFSLAAAISSASLPALTEPAVRALQLHCQAALAPLADALALLAQADGCTTQQVAAACSSEPAPLAAAVAATMAGGQMGAEDQQQGQLDASCCRLLAALLQRQDWAAAFLVGASGEEHQAALLDGGSSSSSSSGGGAGSSAATVGGAICLRLVELFLRSAGAASQEQQQDTHLQCALGGLLAYSPAAKQVTAEVGLPASLLASMRCLVPAARQAAPAQPTPAQPAAAVSRTAKLQELKRARRGGSNSSSAASSKPAPAMAFGSRVRSSVQQPQSSSSRKPLAAECGDAEPAAVPPAPTCSPAAPTPAARVSEQPMLLCLGLLTQLAYGSESASSGLVAAGLLDLVGGSLWGAGGAAVQHCLLGLLGNMLTNSLQARQALIATGEMWRLVLLAYGWKTAGRLSEISACRRLGNTSSNACNFAPPVPAGEPPLLERLTALVLSSRAPLATLASAAATLSCFAATPEGCWELVHGGFLPRALRCLQDWAAGKDWRRLAPILQVPAAAAPIASGGLAPPAASLRPLSPAGAPHPCDALPPTCPACRCWRTCAARGKGSGHCCAAPPPLMTCWEPYWAWRISSIARRWARRPCWCFARWRCAPTARPTLSPSTAPCSSWWMPWRLLPSSPGGRRQRRTRCGRWCTAVGGPRRR